ncbi:hemerythrin domain-containing protein [Aquabacterium sp.]|uniref:hemerythrin domain-containing protein n=1 Tax=Aquabacterium sp. TaxID=1872578 RepID=UPI003D6C7EEF
MQNHLIPVLREDHAVLQELVREVQSTTADFRKKQRLTNDLYLSLNSHLSIVEHTVLPMLYAVSGRDLPDMFANHCEDLRELLSDLLAQRTHAAGLNATLNVLCQVLALHIKRECLFLIPAIDRVLDADERAHQALQSFGQGARDFRKGLFDHPAAHRHLMA